MEDKEIKSTMKHHSQMRGVIPIGWQVCMDCLEFIFRRERDYHTKCLVCRKVVDRERAYAVVVNKKVQESQAGYDPTNIKQVAKAHERTGYCDYQVRSRCPDKPSGTKSFIYFTGIRANNESLYYPRINFAIHPWNKDYLIEVIKIVSPFLVRVISLKDFKFCQKQIHELKPLICKGSRTSEAGKQEKALVRLRKYVGKVCAANKI